MKAAKNTQSGFSTPFMIVIAALVVIGIATVGVMVYHSDKTTKSLSSTVTSPPKTTKKSTTSTTNQSQQTASPTTLDITQWGVHLTLNSTTSSLYYDIKSDNPNVAYLSLKSISDVAPSCAANQISLGAIVRLTPAEQATAPNSDFSIPGTIEIGNYWYGYDNSHAACTDGTAAMNEAVQNAAPNFDRSTLQNTFNTISSD